MFQSFDICLINNHIIKFDRTRQTSEGLSSTYHDFLCPDNLDILLNGIGRLVSAPGAYPLLIHKNFAASGPRTILNSLQNSLAAELVNATSKTFLA